MSVRAAAAPGQIEVKEIRTRIENEDQAKPERLPELWDFVESLTDADWASNGYRFVIERGRPEWKADDRVYIGDFFEKLTPADIAKRWGGGEYTIWFKVPPKGQQLKYKKGLKVDGAPLTSTVGASSTHPGGGQAPPYNDPLSRLIDLMDRRLAQMEAKLDATGIGAVNEAAKQALLLNSQVFGAALPAVSTTLQDIAGGRRAENPLVEKFMAAAIDRLLAPPSAPGPVSNSVKDFLEMITALKTAGLFAPPGAGNTMQQLALEGIRVLPSAITEGVKGLEHWRFAEEARARSVALQRGAPIDVRPVPPPPVSAAGPAPPPPVNPGDGNPPGVQVNIETIEAGLVRILTNQSYTIEEAAHRAAALMEDLVPGMPEQVASAGEAQILSLFQTRPILRQVPQNPRLSEFIKKFIEVVKGAPIATGQEPPPKVPSA